MNLVTKISQLRGIYRFIREIYFGLQNIARFLGLYRRQIDRNSENGLIGAA
jgi:hypothetical protein